ncbi:hypothetical protein R3P38DRAFT_2838260 [Favolaschia claudopus]|uniref:Uncharacterized protein n=1 Tax=Favolaschia claudopus TaxID=2862362 RepID=A0AAW0E9G5_9AGAR
MQARLSLPPTPTILMATLPSSPLYETIAEQVATYIDAAVTEPMANWRPPLVGGAPMELTYDYEMDLPVPPGLDAILAISEVSDEHRSTLAQVFRDLLSMPEWGGAQVFIKELRMAYRCRVNNERMNWHYDRVNGDTPFVANYILLARAERALKRHRQASGHPPSNPLRSRHSNLLPLLDSIFHSESELQLGFEKRLPSYIGSRVHARLVEMKAKLNAAGIGQDLSLVSQ